MVKELLRRQVALLLAALVALSVIAGAIMPAYASANYSPSILSDTPYSYWRLGEAVGATTAADVKGHNALTYSAGGVTLNQPGAILGDPNSAATFNGSTGVATAAVAGMTATSNWSVEAWVNPSNLNQAGTMVYNGVSGTNGYGFGMSSPTSLTTAGSELTGIVNGTIADSGYGFPSPNTWYHVVMTRDTSTIRFYVNGTATSRTSATAPAAIGARFSLGAGINSTSQVVRPYAGGIDEAAVYTVQLSAGRIAAHFQDGAAALSGIGQWISPATVPAGRYDAASAFDASAGDGTHGKLVVFGGENSASAAVQETWTWDGTNWTKLTPATSPSARWGARMVYDTATGLIYLFGGYTGSGQGYLNDTWKWDGTTWTNLTPATSPTIRLDMAMAYDAATSTVVLFGGSKGTTYYAETWSWNGTTWSNLAPSPSPTLRANAGMTYDAAHSRIVLFGGYSGSAYLADTWLWSGTAWAGQTPGTAPSARTSAAMAYNPITSTTMLFGGLNGTSYYADSWSWDGTNWGLESSTSNPGARSTAVMAWDATTANIVLFDGRNSTAPLTDTWNRNTPPGVATGVAGVAGNTQVTVSWTAALSGGSAVTQYVVTASPGGQPRRSDRADRRHRLHVHRCGHQCAGDRCAFGRLGRGNAVHDARFTDRRNRHSGQRACRCQLDSTCQQWRPGNYQLYGHAEQRSQRHCIQHGQHSHQLHRHPVHDRESLGQWHRLHLHGLRDQCARQQWPVFEPLQLGYAFDDSRSADQRRRHGRRQAGEPDLDSGP